MTCREAQDLLFNDRDFAGNSNPGFNAHVATCTHCQRLKEDLAVGLATWRSDWATAAIPDVEREWHAVRRLIRGAPTQAESRRSRMGWFVGPLTAAAAVAVALLVSPNSSDSIMGASPTAHIARADLVEVPDKSSAIVYVDEKNGWLFVLASDPVPKSG